nr:MAG TPA: hypothetical protein [Caudoviricetes sp.]
MPFFVNCLSKYRLQTVPLFLKSILINGSLHSLQILNLFSFITLLKLILLSFSKSAKTSLA